jgi:hypothetical protein
MTPHTIDFRRLMAGLVVAAALFSGQTGATFADDQSQGVSHARRVDSVPVDTTIDPGPVDSKGKLCLSSDNVRSRLDEFQNTTYRLTVRNGCGKAIAVTAEVVDGPSKNLKLDAGQSDTFSCTYFSYTGEGCRGFGAVTAVWAQ